MKPLVVTRPFPFRLASATTLVIIVTWAALNGDTSQFGVLAYPAIVALQTAREWVWRLEVSRKGLHERPGIGPARTVDWKEVEAVVMPNAAWWRINPVLRIAQGPNIQLTAAEGIELLVNLAVKKGKEVEGSADSISMGRSLLPWMVLLALSSLLLGSELAGLAT